jgi:sugar transferase (PEP-CTERM/EpsH1 system associated)
MPELLFLCHRVPFPPDKGEKIRAWHILQHLAKTHDVHLGCLADDPADLAQLDELCRLCKTVGCFRVYPVFQKARALLRMRSGYPLTPDAFDSPGLRRWVADTLSRRPVERLFVFSSAMAGYVRHQKASMRVLDMVDIDSEKWRAYAPHHRWPMRSLYRREADTLLALERQLVQDFDATLFVSKAEANRFSDLAPESRDRIHWIDNGVDLARFSPKQVFPSPFPDGHTNIVFTGTMDYWPNIDAVVWFVDAVLPLVRQEYRSAHFWIVGAKPGSAVSRLRYAPAVTVTGTVPDVRPFLAHADVVVAPLRIARGIQNKVLEAMAMARPVVATPEAFEGIRAKPSEDLLIAGTADQMARSIVRVLNQDYPRLGSAARAAVERNHDWATTLQALDRFFSEPPTFDAPPPAVGRSALHGQNIHSITPSVLLP